jgi:hypothetical protein
MPIRLYLQRFPLGPALAARKHSNCRAPFRLALAYANFT